jgi:hypothetical protein
VNIDVRATEHVHERCIGDHVTATLDVSLVGHIHNVPARGRAADTQPLGYRLLRQHGIFADQRKDLLLAVR